MVQRGNDSKEHRYERNVSLAEDRKLLRLIGQLAKKQAAINRRYAKLHPPDPPNRHCHYALIRGFQLSNARGPDLIPNNQRLPRVGDLRRFFTFGSEKAYVWTHTENQESGVLVYVSDEIHAQKVWRTLATAMRCYAAFIRAFEHIGDAEYVWIYHFDRTKPLVAQDLGGAEIFVNGEINTVHFWAENAHVLELLLRDEKFYISVMHLLQAFEIHWFCLICSLAKAGQEKHPHSEPGIWELADILPKLESAIVQATKAVEGILGKPGNRDTPARLQRMLSRWAVAIELDPNSTYERAGQSWLDYYYSLFDVRGQAAHGLGSISLRMTRREAVLAQTFAFIVLSEYLKKNAVTQATALQKLQFNRALLRETPRNWMTPLTRSQEDRGKVNGIESKDN